ncbi:flagellar biosynthesis protein FlhF [Bacillus sp. ISL-18]|uniref:flagellar biosynthesis protein FlhF n=1 Tax=Bacillus sp. ISL-18 TaxID=2819118 RepID=UPI001BEC12E9|nr:flagellar biosynthesis protein FlhF [Bacillus sp. ISL-18]MBT2657843.1 flagellar biosynthesis protein FlhF [Bacillus sp. ISL-18]
MKTEKIIADSMPLALRMVRQQLGENAIIVNTKTIKKGGIFGLFGKEKYEVTAYSVERDSQQRPVPKYILERKNNQQKPNAEKPDTGRQTVAPLKSKNPAVPKKTQKLYGYHAQSVQTSEATQTSPSLSNEAVRVETAIKQEDTIDETGSPFAEKGFQPLTHIQNKEKQVENQVVKEVVQASVSEKNDAAPAESDGNDAAVLNELQHMRKMLMSFMMNDKQGQAMPTGVTKWVNRLKKQGVDQEVVEYIVDGLLKKVESVDEASDSVLKEEIRKAVIEIIEKRIPESNSVNEGTRMINIVGPTGVGKTTSIAKLATEQVLKQKRRVAMITTDVYRIAAVEQLKTYAAILNIPFEVVRSAEELVRVLNNLKRYDLIYMDTTGRNYKELQNRECIAGYLNQPFESDNYLVLSLTTKFEDIEVLLDEFLESPIKKLIMTKFDETTSFGSILNIAYKYPYELAYITNGQSVPEDITAMNAKLVASYILGEEK